MDCLFARRVRHFEHVSAERRASSIFGKGRSCPLVRKRSTVSNQGIRCRPNDPNDSSITVARVASASSNPDSDSSDVNIDRQPGAASSSASSSDDEFTSSSTAGKSNAGFAASAGVLGGIVLLMLGSYLGREQIKAFLEFFITAVDEWGSWGYLAYAAVYTGLEVMAVPAIPLTMTAGVIFGPIVGTGIVAVSATTAATIAFLLARYTFREKVLKFAQKNAKFAAIDKAIGKDGLKFVFLLRLSPLLPLAASNYLYGLTSVDLPSYVIGSLLGMLPGSYAYVTAGHLGKAVLLEGEGSIGVESWQLGLGLASTLLALGFIGHLAKKAIDGVEKEQ